MAAQPPGSAFPDAAAVPLVDGGAYDCAEEVCQTSGTAGVYGIIFTRRHLCKTEKISGYCHASIDALFPMIKTVPAMALEPYMQQLPMSRFLNRRIMKARHKQF